MKKNLDFKYTQNRELSWLKFNQRVLQEADDSSVPLLERLKFVSIFTSNLDEFYMIRCGSLYDVSLVDSESIDNKTGNTPQEQLNNIYEATRVLYAERDKIYNKISKKLEKYGVKSYQYSQLNTLQKEFIRDYFYSDVLPILSPQIMDTYHPFPHLINKKIYIYSILEKKGKKLMGLIQLPSSLPKYIKFPETHEYILMEDIIYGFVEEIFENYDLIYKTIIAVTRNADINLNERMVDEDEDYRHYMKNILKKRKRLAPIRLEFFRNEEDKYTKVLRKRLDLKKNQVFLTNSPINTDFIYQLVDSFPKEFKKEKTFIEFAPQKSPKINPNISIFKQLDERDILLFYPYQTMDQFLNFLKEAANDPEVLSIKITLYRVARSSSVIKYLLEAIENEKDVTVLIELRARFDESNNIHYAELLEEAGCRLIYGFEDYKVHSKICCVTRRNKNKLVHYTQIGTGNYNEKTAKLYSDYCYLTSDVEIGEDAIEFFKNMSLSNLNGRYKDLLVAPKGLKSTIIHYIDEEIKKAQKNYSCGIIMKMNSLTDRKIIDKLVEASSYGVPIKMIIRGICCIIPGLDKTENIEVRSIVGRYLEHARVYSFGVGDETKVYISSADIMTRNMSKRVEIACPIKDEDIKNRILDDLDIMFKDDIKGRRINSEGNYEKIVQDKHFNSHEIFQNKAIDSYNEFESELENQNILSKILDIIKGLF